MFVVVDDIDLLEIWRKHIDLGYRKMNLNCQLLPLDVRPPVKRSLFTKSDHLHSSA